MGRCTLSSEQPVDMNKNGPKTNEQKSTAVQAAEPHRSKEPKELFRTLSSTMHKFVEHFGRKRPPNLRLRERFQSFQALLQADNEALEVMGDMEAKYFLTNYPFDRQYIRDSYNQMREKVLQMTDALNSIVPNRYRSLYDVFENIDRGIQEIIFGVKEITLSPLTIPFEELTKELAETVGGKNANLGEMRNHLGLPIPEGFAISAYAYKIFIEKTVLSKEVRKRLAALNIHDSQALNRLSREIQQTILSAPVPEELEEAIFQAYDRLSATEGKRVPISVRSSAVREDGDVSFAGQYATELNVGPEHILAAYKKVLASKFAPQAIFYWKEKGFNEEDIPVAVGCQTMICARASGVMYSQDPNHVDRSVAIISAVWGLGEEMAGAGEP